MKTTAVSAVTVANCLIAGLTGVQAIDQLDLGPIKVKLMRQDGENWSVEQVNAVEKWYKRFLLLNLLHPSATIVPTQSIDIFWHYHILDTRKYAEDCQKVFGAFFHHFPYFGMRDDEDLKNHTKAVADTQDLFLSQFGEALSELSAMFSFVFSAHSKCNGEPICTGDPNDEVRTDCVTRPAFVH